MSSLLKIESISQLMALLQIITSFYSIHLKDKCPGELKYRRQYYDFQEGNLFFLAPEESVAVAADFDRMEDNLLPEPIKIRMLFRDSRSSLKN
jgi:hypothetical protein